jgi:poly-gamma-glutamate synthesis protein (capsule biosynthesis protein)
VPLTVAGDFTWPSKGCIRLNDVIEALSSSPLVLNFEGAIVDGAPESVEVINDLKFNLYSVDTAIAELKRLNVVCVGLANNHIGDYQGACARTIERLQRGGFSYFGLERHPCTDLCVDSTYYRFIGVASPLTEITSERNGLSANYFAPDKVLRMIRDWRAQSPDLKIVVFAHWGYELARYPLPADRAWAHQAIRSGADFVIGHHPHLVQGCERVGNGIVAYSLGNFVLPQVIYRGRHLCYSDPAVADELAITLEDDPTLYWMKYNLKKQEINFDGSEPLSMSARIKELTPFSGMTDREYRYWFNQVRNSGTANIKRGLVTLWSYSGVWKVHCTSAMIYLRLRRRVRSILICLGLHRPYNWEEPK